MKQAYFLHIRKFQETSVLLDCFTEEMGIITCIAKGAKRPKSKWRGLVQPFILVNLDWRGKGEVKTLIQLEANAILPRLTGRMILVGMYVNELVLSLLHRADPHPELFHYYHDIINHLSVIKDEQAIQVALRKFECQLLTGLGFGLDFEKDIKNEMIVEDVIYGFDPEQGFFPQKILPQSQRNTVVSGATLMALNENISFQTPTQLLEAKRLMRQIITHHLGNKVLKTRKLFSDVARWTDNKEEKKYITSTQEQKVEEIEVC